MIYIYLIRCPKDNAVIYVGQTTRKDQRFSVHVSSKTKTPISLYIQKLKTDGLLPIFEVVRKYSINDGGAKENSAEKRLIIKYKKDINSRILNRYLTA